MPLAAEFAALALAPPVQPAPLPFATHRDDRSPSLLSVLAGAHSTGGGILGFLNQRHACALRLTCVEARDAVASAPWLSTSRIYGSVRRWRRCFPLARAADVAWRIKSPLYNADFAHLRGLVYLNMTCCDCESITDDAFRHLVGIKVLYLSACGNARISDRAFSYLRGIKELYMSGLKQKEITDAAFAHLAGVETLFLVQCDQPGITDRAFEHLGGIRTLRIDECPQFTDAAFKGLAGLHELHLNGCTQPGLTEAAFDALEGVQVISTDGCHPDVQRAARRAIARSNALKKR